MYGECPKKDLFVKFSYLPIEIDLLAIQEIGEGSQTRQSARSGMKVWRRMLCTVNTLLYF